MFCLTIFAYEVAVGRITPAKDYPNRNQFSALMRRNFFGITIVTQANSVDTTASNLSFPLNAGLAARAGRCVSRALLRASYGAFAGRGPKGVMKSYEERREGLLPTATRANPKYELCAGHPLPSTLGPLPPRSGP